MSGLPNDVFISAYQKAMRSLRWERRSSPRLRYLLKKTVDYICAQPYEIGLFGSSDEVQQCDMPDGHTQYHMLLVL